MRMSGATISSASARWIPTAASIAAFGILERREEAVARLLDDLAAGVGDALAHELVVAREQPLPLVVPERLQELRGVDDVGEEEGATRFDAAEQLLDACLLDGGAESLERGQRRLELDRTRMRVSAPHVGDAEKRSRACGLVRCPDPLPVLACLLQRRDRRPASRAPRPRSGHARSARSRRTRQRVDHRSCTRRRCSSLSSVAARAVLRSPAATAIST